MTRLARGIGAVCGVLAAWALAASSAVSAPWHGTDAAAVRLSWVARPERIEVCRELSAEERAELPAHMRVERECTGASATYRLSLTVDGDSVAAHVLHGGGLRRDRAIYVLDEFPVSPGERRLQVTFTRVEPADAPIDSANVRRGAIGRALALDTTVTISANAVALVSLREGRLQLQLP